ncbi:MAG: MoxR family ATPase [Granulosicoccaceae bacterium]
MAARYTLDSQYAIIVSMNTHENKLAASIQSQGYVADEQLIASLQLMSILQKPLLIEGEAGVGKTDVARCLARAHNAELIRLQCYEGLDAQHALYDWDYKRQLLAIQLNNIQSKQKSGIAPDSSTLYDESYLLKRPLFKAITSKEPAVLLIDEVDRADEEFEALLLEVLADFQITVPELGTFTSVTKPWVILTSNGVRELSDALRRRCLYHYIDFPGREKEMEILIARIPDIDQRLANQVVDYVQNLRSNALRKTPGVAETLDWAAALLGVGVKDLQNDDQGLVSSTMGCLLKTREDLELVNFMKTEAEAQQSES